MTNHMAKLTEHNQGYRNRIKRPRSWVKRAQALEFTAIDSASDTDSQELFIMYWISFNALYGRVNETGQGRYLRPGDDDARWFLRRICDLDAGTGRIGKAVVTFRKDAHSLLKSRCLSETYWREGYSPNVRRRLEEETTAAAQLHSPSDEGLAILTSGRSAHGVSHARGEQ